MTDLHAAFPREPVPRLEHLLDPSSLRLHDKTPGVVTGTGAVDGAPVAAFACDPSSQGGALGGEACRAIARLVDDAVTHRRPVIGLWHSGGAKVQEGVESLDGMGRLFAAFTRASGQLPHISVVLGPAAGGAAYGPALSDVVISAPEALMFVTGPAVVREVTGQDVSAEDLGSPEVHGVRSGLVHVEAPSAAAAVACARALSGLLSGVVVDHPSPVEDARMDAVLPDRARRAYDVRHVVELLLDDDGRLVQLHKRWAPNVATWTGRLVGRPVGVLANNPLRLGGCLDGKGSDKAARFVRLCDGLGLPLIVLVDVPGYLPGGTQEEDGIIRRGAKLLHAFAEATVPRITVVTRKAYGGAYIAMNSASLGADAVLAWPTAQIDVMGPEAAVQVLHRKALAALPAEQRAAAAAELVQEVQQEDGLALALELGLVDEVIAPRRTRLAVAQRLAELPPRRGVHGNIPL